MWKKFFYIVSCIAGLVTVADLIFRVFTKHGTIAKVIITLAALIAFGYFVIILSEKCDEWEPKRTSAKIFKIISLVSLVILSGSLSLVIILLIMWCVESF